MSVLVGRLVDGNGLVIDVYAEQIGGSVKFTISVVEGFADLRGFFLDVAGSGTGHAVSGGDVAKVKAGNDSVTDLGNGVNMNGTKEKFDIGMSLGTAGIGKDDIQSTTVTIAGISLDDLDGLSFGVRATSVGAARQDSVKLVGTFDVPDDECCCSFPDLADDIVSVKFLFDIDPDPQSVDLYAVEVANWTPEANDDLDASIEAMLAYIFWRESDPNDPVHEDPAMAVTGEQFVGAQVLAGATERFYASDCDPDEDALPGVMPYSPAWSVDYTTVVLNPHLAA
jgi:hypothetical protein